MKKSMLPVALGAALATAAVTTASAATLEDVQSRGTLRCAVSTGLVGYSYTDENGKWQGFDVDYCRAVAAAVLNDADAVEYSPTTGKTRFTALASGEVDILSRNTTWTLSRDADLKFTFLGISYFDGQGFMVKKSLGVDSALQLDGATVCIQTGTTTELNLADYFAANDMSYEPLSIETNTEGRANYLADACDVYTTDASGLAASRATFDDASEHIILPEIISKEPLGPLVRHGDDQWADIGRWVLNALKIAEEKGVTAANADDMAANSKDPEVLRLLGSSGEYGAALGLDNDFALKAIKAVGNYGEIFEKHLGTSTSVNLSRGLNAMWTEGGLQYAPPFR